MSTTTETLDKVNGWTYDAAFGYIRDRIEFAVNEDREEPITHQQIAFKLMDFEEIHGRKAIWDLCGAFHYFNKYELDKFNNRIKEFFYHDVLMAKDEFMLPRCDGYIKYVNC